MIVSNSLQGGMGGRGISPVTAPIYDGREGGTVYGAGICSKGPLQIERCTIRDNVATGGTGGFGVPAETCYPFLCSNPIDSAGGPGGVALGAGIYSEPSAVLVNCTLAANRAFGGMAGDGGAIVAGGPTGNGLGGPGGSAAGGGLSGWTVNDILGNSSFPVDPLLGPLQDNGGPTWTLALLPNSPARDQGRSSGLTTDQRGRPRVYDSPAVTNAAGGDGSDIGAVEMGAPPLLAIRRLSNEIELSWPTPDGVYRLQSATGLSSSDHWTTVEAPLVLLGGNYCVTNNVMDGAKFYRLINP